MLNRTVLLAYDGVTFDESGPGRNLHGCVCE